MRKGATLIELIFTLVIASILTMGTASILNDMGSRVQKAKQLTNLSLDTQSALDQISNLLYFRVPNSPIGYNPPNYEPLANLTGQAPILEWFGTFNEGVMLGSLYSFIDLNASNFTTSQLVSPKSNFATTNTQINQKFDGGGLGNSAIIFAGSFDYGTGVSSNFGWHGSNSDNAYDVANGINDDQLQIADATQPEFIYEKFYLIDTAYAIARGEDIDTSANCITNLNVPSSDMNNALFLFYDYHPWGSETFCADPNGTGQSGKASVLAFNISSFSAQNIDFTIRLSVEATQTVRGSDDNISISKQKVIL